MAQESSDIKSTKVTTPFKFNVHAPEFVPMSPTASPMSEPAAGYYSPFLQMPAGLGPDWSFFHDHEPVFFVPDFAHAKLGAAAAAAGSNSGQAKGSGAADIAQKIVKQVEYYFRDINLVANEFLLKIMNKDSEGYGGHCGLGYSGVELAANISQRLKNTGIVKAINVQRTICPSAPPGNCDAVVKVLESRNIQVFLGYFVSCTREASVSEDSSAKEVNGDHK